MTKKALVLSVKLALNTQLVFTCSKSGVGTLEQVVKYVQSLYVNSEQISHVVPMFSLLTAWAGWIVERNVF